MKKVIARLGLFLLLITLSAPVIAAAADYLPKEKTESGNVTVSDGNLYKNLFVAGANVFVNQKIFGDLFLAGGSANITSPVEDDLMLAGGNVNISAPVGGDARIAGGNIMINAPISGDLMVGGGTVNIGQTALIGGDFWSGAGVLNLNSNVKGNLKVAGGEILINSRIDGSAEIRASEKLVFGPNTKISGPITYWGTKEAEILEGAQVGQVDFRKTERKETGKFETKKIFGTLVFIKMLALFVSALILLKIFGRTSLSIASRSHTSPWSNLGIGILNLIAFPLVALLLMITGIGFILGLVLLLIFATTLILASVFASLFMGSLLERWIFKKELDLTWKTAAWGVFAGTVIGFIPIVGWLLMFLVYLISFGSSMREIKSRLEV